MSSALSCSGRLTAGVQGGFSPIGASKESPEKPKTFGTHVIRGLDSPLLIYLGSKNHFSSCVSFQVARNKDITVATLGVFSWSLFQFTLVTTSMGEKDDKQEETEIGDPDQVNNHKTVKIKK